MIANKKIPALRFPEFEDEWEEKKMKDITKINQGLQIPISERFTEKVENSFFYITNEFLKENSEKKYYIQNPPPSVLCDKNDILMTRTGNTGKVVTNVEGAFHNNFFKIKYEKEVCEKLFLYYFLNLETTQTEILKLAGTSTIPDLNHGDFYRIKINTPLITEQQKIASFLTAIDDKIQQLIKKKALLEDYKKGVMQQLFSQQIRFKDDNGNDYPDWEEKKLGNYVDIKSGGSPANYHLKEKGVFPFLKVEELNNSNKYQIHNSREYTDIETNVVEPFSIIFPKRGAAIMTNKVRVNKVAVQIDSNLMAIKPIDSRLNPEYLYYVITYTQLFKIADTSTIPQINNKHIIPYKFKLPSTSEQEKIANFLIIIDDKINTVNKQLEQTQHYKKGLLQQMFV